MEEKHPFSGWPPLSEADTLRDGKPGSLLGEEVVLTPLSSTLGRWPSAFGSRRSWPSGPRPEQEKTESCLPRKRTAESRAAETYVELIGAINFLRVGRNRMSRSRPSGLRPALKLRARPEKPRRHSHRKSRTEPLLPFGSADATHAGETLCVRR